MKCTHQPLLHGNPQAHDGAVCVCSAFAGLLQLLQLLPHCAQECSHHFVFVLVEAGEGICAAPMPSLGSSWCLQGCWQTLQPAAEHLLVYLQCMGSC